MSKLEFLLSDFHYGESVLSCSRSADGQLLAECTIMDGVDYSVKELQKMLGLEKAYRGLGNICREIWEHNKEMYERNKRSYAKTFGWGVAERYFGKYPSFEKRLKR